MKVYVQIDQNDAIVLIDRAMLGEIDEEIMYAMDIYLDPNGETEINI